MKLVIAYIQPDRLNPVKQALYARNVFKISVTNALGCGQQRGYSQMWRGALPSWIVRPQMSFGRWSVCWNASCPRS